jgi:hypothetical protein
MSDVHLMKWRLLTMSLAVAACSALAQGSGSPAGEDRGYEDSGGLQSHGAGSSALSDAGATDDVASATARGRESASGVVQDPGKASNKKAETFKSAEAATDAFIEALRKGDSARLEAIFVDPVLISSGDAVADRIERERFLKEYDRKHSLGGRESGMITLYVGESARPFAVPIVKGSDGYYFNYVAGARDVIFRRIGRNERRAIAVCSGFVAAQKEYALSAHDGQPSGAYAQKLMSDEGKRNGLYWPSKPDELRSPAGQALAAASAEGYSTSTSGKSTPYHGYLYRMLTAQGEHAREGPREYIDGSGRQVGGFAIIAYPAEYGRSGVKSFIVNQDSIVYEKDLGPKTAETVQAMGLFDPQGWKVAL